MSGIAALMLERDGDLTPDRLRDILLETAKDLGPKGRDIMFGAGPCRRLWRADGGTGAGNRRGAAAGRAREHRQPLNGRLPHFVPLALAA